MERHKFERACKLFISRKKHGQAGNVGSGYDVYLGGGLLCLLALLPVMSAAQTPDDINAKFQAMEQRIKALESEVSTLKAALSATPEARAPQVTRAPAQMPIQPVLGTGGTPQLSDATARLMNPAISMIGNVLGAAGHNPVDQRP